jgi:hypothetical protein
MPDAVEVAIEAALLARAQAFATAQSVTIALPRIDFTPPAPGPTVKWLRASFFPTPTETLSIGSGTNMHSGLFQIDCFCGVGGGLVSARLRDAAIAYFKRDTTMTRDGFTTQIRRAPWPIPGDRDDGWWRDSMRLAFICFASNPS